METPPRIWLRTICLKNGLSLNENQLGLLEQYVGRLLDWNRKINLISRQDEDSVWQNHILHSLAPLFFLTLRSPSVVMDLGTGGGLPGIPWKVVLPESQFLLVDATRKKVSAVEQMVGALGLHGIDVRWGRAEELAKDGNLLSHFDYIVARAVAPLKDLISWSRPFLKIATTRERPGDNTPLSPSLITLKGGDLEEEIAEARRRGQAFSFKVFDLVFPGSEELSLTGKKVIVVQF